MKTISNIIISNSPNVKSEHLLAVIITLVFNEESSVTAWMSFKEFANTELKKLPLDDLESPRHWLAKLHVRQIIAWNIRKCMQFSVAIFDAHACSYYIWLQLQRDAQ